MCKGIYECAEKPKDPIPERIFTESEQAKFDQHQYSRLYFLGLNTTIVYSLTIRPRLPTPHFVQSIGYYKALAQYSGCVFSNRNAPDTMDNGTSMIIDLLLKKLLGRSHGLIIFPLYAFLATRSTLPMGHILPR